MNNKIPTSAKDMAENVNHNTNARMSYNSFDIAKLICSVLVVIIHIPLFGVQNEPNTFYYLNFALKNCICRIAVPIFFVFSGFLLYKKSSFDSFSTSPTKKYFKHILIMYLLWSLIYFPLALIPITRHPDGILQGLTSYIIDLIFAGSYRHLWYLNGLLPVVALISYFITKKFSPKKILIISSVFYAVGIFGNAYYGLTLPLQEIPFIEKSIALYYEIFRTTRNGLFFGFLFVSTGMYFSQNDIKISPKKALILFIASVLMMIAEVYLISRFNLAKEYDMLIFTVPATIFLFLFLYNVKLNDHPIYKKIREISSLMYYLHILVGWVVSNTFSIVNESLKSTPAYFIATIILTFVASVIIIRISKNKPFTWLKKLY